MKLAAILVLITINISYSQVILNANGPNDTYELITSVFAQGNGVGAVEAPDSHHVWSAGRHIVEVFDIELNKYVFEFYSHALWDNEPVDPTLTDRQRVEIKTYAASPANLKGTLGENIIYKWRFKIPIGFQPSANFTHLHQIKAVDGDDSSPIFTLTPRIGTPNKLELIYVANASSGTDKVSIVNLLPFEGNWIDAEETINVGSSGTYSIKLKKHSDGTILLSYSNSNIATIRPDNTFIRPKWGIYRSLNDVENLRDEAVRFSDFSIAEVASLAINSISNDDVFAALPNPIIDKLELSDEILQQFDSLRLFDITGKLLLEKCNLLNEIDVSFLKTGLYFIQFSNNQNQSVSIKIIKK
ncbi:Secretion system C-terminal sorting domain [Flavobacteriaceae bacterium]